LHGKEITQGVFMKRFMTALTLLSLVTSTVNATAATGIVGNWHLDTEKGQTAQDSSPYGKHGRLGSTHLLIHKSQADVE
jgi:hypothetical protein